MHTLAERPSTAPSHALPLRREPSAGQTSTWWSVIVRAQGSGDDARRALDQLFRRYDRTVTALIRAFGHPWDHSAEDLKQEFFRQVLKREDVRRLDRARGKFRSWLRSAVKNFMRNVWAAWHAAKLGNTTDRSAAEPAHDCTPELLAMRQFAEDTLIEALARHRALARNAERFQQLIGFLPGPQIGPGDLAPLAAQLGTSTNALTVQIHELRARHRRILREVVAETLDVDASTEAGARAIDDEMKELVRLLRDVPRCEPLQR